MIASTNEPYQRGLFESVIPTPSPEIDDALGISQERRVELNQQFGGSVEQGRNFSGNQSALAPVATPILIPERVGSGGFDTREPPPNNSRKKKRIAITSYEAFQKIMPTLSEREAMVIIGLERFINKHRYPPTAYELFEYIKVTDKTPLAFDINSVRPVLTRLKDKQMVLFGIRKICSITKTSAYSWIFPEVVQETLFKETNEQDPIHRNPNYRRR